MKKYIIHFLILLFIGASLPGLKAQGVFNKIKNKTEDKIVDKIFGEEDNNNGSNKNSGDNNSSSGVSNTRGGGLNAKTPDVKENIDLASKSFDDKEYSDARYAVREAILGIELEIGKNILADLPEKIESLPAVTDEDNVTSSGIGFVGLVVSRVYRSDDMELRVTVANDAAMLSAVNIYFSSGYASTSDDENIQRTKFQDENAIIEWDENSGYKLSVPFGQSSLLMIEGVNFETQEAFTAACGKFNLDHIKNQLGEK
ncbi:MAG: hypothetical protein KDC05_04610 [Bacteroidales bacterium]|nr:hypothetical protein [Bacteroidales bacterium]